MGLNRRPGLQGLRDATARHGALLIFDRSSPASGSAAAAPRAGVTRTSPASARSSAAACPPRRSATARHHGRSCRRWEGPSTRPGAERQPASAMAAGSKALRSAPARHLPPERRRGAGRASRRRPGRRPATPACRCLNRSARSWPCSSVTAWSPTTPRLRSPGTPPLRHLLPGDAGARVFLPPSQCRPCSVSLAHDGRSSTR